MARTDYKLIIREPDGEKAMEEITDFLWLSYTRKRNRPGLLSFGLPQGHEAIGVLGNRYQVEAHRRILDSDGTVAKPWYQDMGAIFLEDLDRSKIDLESWTAYVPGYLRMLAWRRVMWFAGTANRSKFGNKPGETVMKTLVRFNATAEATIAAGRQEFEGAITWPGAVVVQGDEGRGNRVDWNCAWDELLESLYDLSRIGGGDYDLVRKDDNTFEFRFYPGQRGTDRTEAPTRAMFSMDFDNIARVELLQRGSQVVSAVLVGGPGTGATRAISSATSSSWSQATHVESFINGANFDTAAARERAGARLIDERRARRTVRCVVQQTDALRYGRDYELGDRVLRRTFGVTEEVLIDEVTVGLGQGGEETIEVGTVLV